MNGTTDKLGQDTNYTVVPMHPWLETAAGRLASALCDGVHAHKDPDRERFYSAVIDGVDYYFHVYPEGRTAYLLWTQLNVDAEPVGAAPASVACHG